MARWSQLSEKEETVRCALRWRHGARWGSGKARAEAVTRRMLKQRRLHSMNTARKRRHYCAPPIRECRVSRSCSPFTRG
jgi:hypothetical protein